jgi:hypothetical protein
MPPTDPGDRDARSGNARHIDHRAAAALEHPDTQPLAANERTRQVQVDQLLPLVQRYLLRGEIDAPAADIIDEDIDRPLQIENLSAGKLRPRWRPDIAHNDRHSAADGRQILSGGFEGIRRAADEDEVGPSLRQTLRDGPAESAAPTRDHHRSAVEAEAVQHTHDDSRLRKMGRHLLNI